MEDGSEERTECFKETACVEMQLILLWKCDVLAVWTWWKKMKAETDTYSGQLDLEFAIFSLQP